jgi:hypothetical protein
VIHEPRIALIVEADGQGAGEAEAMVGLAQQQRAAVGGERAAGEIGHDLAATQVLKEQRLVVTVCQRRSGVVHVRWAQ